jgi:hypothetical protein
MTIQLVEELSATAYREHSVREILPDWLPGINLATHTLNRSNRHLVTDGCRYAPKTALAHFLDLASRRFSRAKSARLPQHGLSQQRISGRAR